MVEAIMSNGVLQRGKSLEVNVKWPKKPDGETEWTSSDVALAVVDIRDESTKATVHADDDEYGEVAIYATASFGGEKATAVLELHVIEGASEDGTIELER